MKSEAIVDYGQPLKEIVSETPQPKGTEVLLKVTHCGVCHSDVHLHDGYFDLDGGNKLDVRGGRKLPFTLGHEIEGEVIAIGEDAEGVTIGQRRVAFPWIGCGQCRKSACPALYPSAEKTAKGFAKTEVNRDLCTGCSLCASVCPVKAIQTVEKGE